MNSEVSDILLYAARMPYNWAAVAGYFLGIQNDLRFGGTCIEQAVLIRSMFPRGTVSLQVDKSLRHFATKVEDNYFDPTYYQYTTDGTYDPWRDEMVYKTLISGTNISVRERGEDSQVSVGYQGGIYKMSGLLGQEEYYIQAVIGNFADTLHRIPPFINFPNTDGFETSVALDPRNQKLIVRDRNNMGGFSPEGRLSEMERTYDFTRDDLLSYFVDIWRGISRLKNV